MPYILPRLRSSLAPRTLAEPHNAGELNFVLTSVVLEYLKTHAGYASFNDAIGALECAKLELYRRMVAPYEDVKIAANGDVYP